MAQFLKKGFVARCGHTISQGGMLQASKILPTNIEFVGNALRDVVRKRILKQPGKSIPHTGKPPQSPYVGEVKYHGTIAWSIDYWGH